MFVWSHPNVWMTPVRRYLVSHAIIPHLPIPCGYLLNVLWKANHITGGLQYTPIEEWLTSETKEAINDNAIFIFIFYFLRTKRMTSIDIHLASYNRVQNQSRLEKESDNGYKSARWREEKTPFVKKLLLHESHCQHSIFHRRIHNCSIGDKSPKDKPLV